MSTQPTDPEKNETVPGLSSQQMTWAWLLSQWVAFAKSAVSLPESGWGKQARESVPHIIQLQALWHALGESSELPAHEKELAIDRAGVLLETHTKALNEIWAVTTSGWPDSMAEIVLDAHLQWAQVATAFLAGGRSPALSVVKYQYEKPVIGMSGGIASGKSFISRALNRLACGIIDSDQIARDLLSRPDVLEEVTAAFGVEILTDGEISRLKLGELVFANETHLATLEAILHPRVHEIRQNERRRLLLDPTVVAVVEDCPLLFEKQIDRDCDCVIFVDTAEEERQRRVVEERGWTVEAFEKREKAQLGLDIKAKRADYVINNNVSREESLNQTAGILSEILRNFPHNNLN